MKQISTVIHPEIILGLRGNPGLIGFHKDILDKISWSEEMGGWTIRSSDLVVKFTHDQNAMNHFYLCKYFINNPSRNVYYIPKDFAQALSSIKKNIPVSILKPGFCAYFQFATNAFIDDTGPVEGGYIAVDYANRLGLPPHERGLAVSISYINQSGEVTRFSAELDDEKIEDFLAKCNWAGDNLYGKVITDFDDSVIEKRNAVYRCFVNALIYIHSSDPDMVRLLPAKSLTKSQRMISREKHQIENMCSLPMTILNRQYALGRTYSVDSSLVSGHLRWQRHGKEFSQVKLIWVNEHERHYN